MPISLTTEEPPPTYCGGAPCRGRLLTLSPFAGGYDDPGNAPMLDISLDKSLVQIYGPSWTVWVQKEDTTAPPVKVPNCKVELTWTKHWHKGFPGKSYWSHGHWHKGPWHHGWWFWKAHTKRVAKPSPCVAKRYIDHQGDAHVQILVLSGDPKFGRR